eukprot:295881-Chlamydomonas_euryale.AAC.1
MNGERWVPFTIQSNPGLYEFCHDSGCRQLCLCKCGLWHTCRQMAGPGTVHCPRLAMVMCWHRLAQAGARWRTLAQASTGWRRRAHPGTYWHVLAQAGTGRRRWCTACSCCAYTVQVGGLPIPVHSKMAV